MSRPSCPRCDRDALLIEALSDRILALEHRRTLLYGQLSKARAARDLWKARAIRYRKRAHYERIAG